jgi:hypothetical protein
MFFSIKNKLNANERPARAANHEITTQEHLYTYRKESTRRSEQEIAKKSL